MKSKLSIQSHPIHPMLVGFPIAFMTSAVVCDLAGWFLGFDRLWAAGSWMIWASLLTGIAAASSGLADYLYRIPPNSSAKARGTQHLLANAGALALFALSLLLRENAAPLERFPLSAVLTIAGLVLVSIGGWLGGTLVYRNQIGVDHRYAQAGKWQELTLNATEPGLVKICGTGDLKPGQMKLCIVNGARLVLARTDRGYVAFGDRCTHKGGPLSDGCLAGDTVQCPWHGSQFEAPTGAVRAGPARAAVRSYLVREERGAVFLPLPLQERPYAAVRPAANI